MCPKNNLNAYIKALVSAKGLIVPASIVLIKMHALALFSLLEKDLVSICLTRSSVFWICSVEVDQPISI